MINPTALELVDTLCDNASKEWCDLIHALHETAHAEGVAEERERIRGNSQMVGVDSESVNFIGSVDNYVGSAFLVPVDVMDPPLLAPKEADHGNS